MGSVNEITDDTFEAEVLKSAKPVLVDYWADWCAPCKQLSPILDELASVHGDKITFVKVDTNANPVTATKQGVLSLPTLQVFVDGQVVKSFQGAKTKNQLLKALDEYL